MRALASALVGLVGSTVVLAALGSWFLRPYLHVGGGLHDSPAWVRVGSAAVPLAALTLWVLALRGMHRRGWLVPIAAAVGVTLTLLVLVVLLFSMAPGLAWR